MHPIETSYQLARKASDYRACHQLLRAEGQDDSVLRFPTVLARRDGELIGFLATHADDRYVIAGPLVVAGRRNPIVALRLIDAYDVVMRLVGIRLYYFSVDPLRIDALSRGRIESLGMRFWQIQDGQAWYKRELT